MFAYFKKAVLDILFPVYCVGCGREGSYFCQDCQATVTITSRRYCLCKPALPIFDSPLKEVRQSRKGKCRKCRSRALDGLYSALSYQEPRARRLIYLFKYEPYIKGLAGPLAFLIVSYFKLLDLLPTLISPASGFILIPIPLHKKKLRRRGYNQAAELARELGRLLNLLVIDNCLIRTKQTLAQVDLPESQRKENVRGAFSVGGAYKIKNQKILLVDDVYTTGSTMEEAAQVLKKAGAEQVWGIAIARG